MNNYYKYLAWAGTAALAILSVFLLVNIQQLADTGTTTGNTVSFSGEGKISAKADLAEISFSIITEGATSKVAQDDNSKKSQKVVDYLKQQGIADKDIKTSGYNVYPQYSYPRPCPLPAVQSGGTGMMETQSYPPVYPCGDDTQKITGYQVIQTFDLKVRDLEKAGVLLDGLVTQGANQVNNLGFQIENQEGLKDQARQMAINDARAKAKNLQNQLGIRLGRIVNYYEGGNYPIYAMEAKGGMGGGGVAPVPSIPSGQNEIVVDVTITYQIR